MKTTHTILALLAAGYLGHSALADENRGPLELAVVQDSHGGQHFLYYQTGQGGDSASVALNTNAGGIAGPLQTQGRVLPDNGETRFVTGNNQHGTSQSAYIPLTSHFAQAQQ